MPGTCHRRYVQYIRATISRGPAPVQITISGIEEKNKRTGCRGSLAREGGSLESYWRFAPREFKSPPRRMNGSFLISPVLHDGSTQHLPPGFRRYLMGNMCRNCRHECRVGSDNNDSGHGIIVPGKKIPDIFLSCEKVCTKNGKTLHSSQLHPNPGKF